MRQSKSIHYSRCQLFLGTENFNTGDGRVVPKKYAFEPPYSLPCLTCLLACLPYDWEQQISAMTRTARDTCGIGMRLRFGPNFLESRYSWRHSQKFPGRDQTGSSPRNVRV